MLQSSHEIWGVVIILLLIGAWSLRRIIGRQPAEDGCGSNHAALTSPSKNHDLEHRALMFLMAQKTDSVLAALARTIDQERQKLGVVVRNPSIDKTIDAFQGGTMPIAEDRQSPYDQIVPMARCGSAVPAIARQLQLPEAEVGMVVRLNAA